MILSQIQNTLGSLTEAESRVAALVLASPRMIPGITAAQAAEKSGVAPSAVIRFCKAMGLKGFSELKILLSRELGAAEASQEVPNVEEGEGTEPVVRRVFASGMQTLKKTVDMLDFERVEAMAQALSQARRIYLFGVGTSSVVAADAQYRFAQLGLSAACCTDILFMNVTAVNLGKEDAVLCISHSGRTKAVVDAMRHARDAGATTLSITSFQDSPLFRESQIALSVFDDEEHYPVEAVSARVAHICLIDALTMVLATRKADTYADHITARNKILREIRYDKKSKEK